MKSNAIENYFQSVIKNSWTWGKLTSEEQQRFINMDFDRIKGTDTMRVEWLNTMYHVFLAGLGYKPIGWRENPEECLKF